MDLPAIYHRHESEKKRQYSQRVKEVEHGVFTPLVFCTTGGMARECSTFYRCLADMISIKQDKPYSLIVSWLRTQLSYASLCAAVMCIRGSRSSHRHPIYEHGLTLATVEGKIPSSVYKNLSVTLVFYALFCVVCGLLYLDNYKKHCIPQKCGAFMDIDNSFFFSFF